MTDNPFAEPPHVDADFIVAGQSVPAGNGWSWLVDAWGLMSRQRGTFIAIFLIYVLISVAVSIVPIVGPLAMALLGPVLNGGVMLGCDALRRGERLDISHLFAGLRGYSGQLMGIGAVTLVAFCVIFAVVALTVGAGAVALMLGGGQPSPEDLPALLASLMIALLVILALSVPLYMAIWFAAPLVVLGQYDVGGALKASFGACMKNMMPFLVWGVVGLGLAIVATIPLGLGWLLLGPVLMISVFTSYRDIFHARSVG